MFVQHIPQLNLPQPLLNCLVQERSCSLARCVTLVRENSASWVHLFCNHVEVGGSIHRNGRIQGFSAEFRASHCLSQLAFFPECILVPSFSPVSTGHTPGHPQDVKENTIPYTRPLSFHCAVVQFWYSHVIAGCQDLSTWTLWPAPICSRLWCTVWSPVLRQPLVSDNHCRLVTRCWRWSDPVVWSSQPLSKSLIIFVYICLISTCCLMCPTHWQVPS